MASSSQRRKPSAKNVITPHTNWWRTIASTPNKSAILITIILTTSLMSLIFSFLDLCKLRGAENSFDVSLLKAMTELDGISTISTPTTVTQTYTSDPNPEAPWPRIAWLMSFPNSGTSFTMRLVGRGSNTTTASNYGTECDLMEDTVITNVDGTILDKALTNQQLYSHSPNGPYVLHDTSRRPLPERYIMTKTHCGSRCNNCGPTGYIETRQSFMEMCAKGSRLIATPAKSSESNKDGAPEKNHVYYDPAIASRAIHLFRNPFNNIVSNFHLEQHENVKKGRTEWLDKYTNDPRGFKRWCTDLDRKHIEEEKGIRILGNAVLELFEDVPCHSSFYMFAQWHNLAIQVTRELKLPTLDVWYEQYEIDFEASVKKISDFLGLPIDGSAAPFIAGKNYDDYFTDKERTAAMTLVQKLADDDTWELVKRYAPSDMQ